MQSHLQKLPPMAANLRRDDDDRRRQTTTDDDRRRQTTRDDDRRRHDARHANTAPTPRPPTINGNPSLRIREKQGTIQKDPCDFKGHTHTCSHACTVSSVESCWFLVLMRPVNCESPAWHWKKRSKSDGMHSLHWDWVGSCGTMWHR